MVPEPSPRRKRWYISVCKTCDRLAEWPFCDHKTDDGRWYDTVLVAQVGRRK